MCPARLVVDPLRRHGREAIEVSREPVEVSGEPIAALGEFMRSSREPLTVSRESTKVSREAITASREFMKVYVKVAPTPSGAGDHDVRPRLTPRQEAP